MPMKKKTGEKMEIKRKISCFSHLAVYESENE